MSTENQNINNNTEDAKSYGFLPFLLVFGGIVVALIFIKILMDLIM